MRKLSSMVIATAIFSAAAIMSTPSQAMTLTTPAAAAAAAQELSAAQEVRYVCRWNGYRRVCWWRPGHWHHRHWW